MRKKIITRFTALALAMILAAGLSACGQRSASNPDNRYEAFSWLQTEPEDAEPETAKPGDAEPVAAEPEDAEPEVAEPEDTEPVAAAPEDAEPEAAEPAAEPAADPDTESEADPNSDAQSRIWERIERLRKKMDEAADGNQEPAEETVQPMESVERIAELGSLTGTGTLKDYEKHDTVDVNDKHNPYDLVWQYGDTEAEKDDDFGKLYASYVDAADWSLVFDAEYYKKAFPMLAKLYHDDDALLLEHFQTVGVHEGRQGSKGFNVSVYMVNCGEDLLEAFGDNYECYYFYYMLNYASEQEVETAGVYGRDPLWLDLELTLAQSNELSRVNWYREEVDADPLVLDPENIAFANYRAWYNAVNSVRGHGWLDDLQNKDVDIVFDILGVNHLGENTTAYYGSANIHSSLAPYVAHYRASQDHYKAMVNTKYVCLGVSHQYYNDDTGWMDQFDTFLRTMPVQDYTMR